MGKYDPMLAELAEEPFDSEVHLYEPKFDGVRCLALVDKDRATLIGRSGKDFTYKFPDVVPALRSSETLVLDGEMVCGIGNRPGFPLMQGRVHKQDAFAIKLASQVNPATYMVFDILEMGGVDTTRLPLWRRKELLHLMLTESDRVKQTLFVEKEGVQLFKDLQEAEFEGVMAKRRDSLYVQKRGRDWLKMKVSEEEVFLAVALTEGQGRRAGAFGALVLAAAEGDTLVPRGEVGSGFNDADLQEILNIAVDSLPYLNATPAMLPGNGPRWIEPIRVKVKFLEKTNDGKLRFPVFVGIERG